MPRPAKMSNILKFFLDKKKNGINMSGKLILSEIKQNTNFNLKGPTRDNCNGYYDELIAVNSEYDIALFTRQTAGKYPLNTTNIIIDLTSKITLEIPATIVSTKELAKEFFGVDHDEDLTKEEKQNG